ncbi:response regulator [Inhella sp.]|uniref:response regulator n=1 Tax=Inhella sp. TaxID=1921806 RepID=UPI0035ADF969
MSFDLPSMLGEYLLPLLILVPLAIVVMLLAMRNQKDEHWSHSRNDPLPPSFAPTPRAAPAPRSEAPASTAVATPEAPAARTAEPAAPAITPFLSPMDGGTTAEAPASSLHEVSTPLQPAATPTVQRRRASDALPGPAAQAGPAPVLIVDDSAVVRAKLSKLLAGAGFAVTVARHGQEALEQLNQHWFAMMITDLEMPEMDGFELIQHVSNDIRTENLPIVAITGHEELGARVADVKGLYGIFKKPWNDRELLARVGVLTQLRPRA